MRLLFLGDIIGRSGREVAERHVPNLRKLLKLDVVVVNGENAAAGFGITGQICQAFYQLGVDVITTGNHIWDQKETLSGIQKDPRLIRPANFPLGTPGKGSYIHQTSKGDRILVINVMGRLYMETLDDP
ncbi:MAG TPA: YmdB family metallophosphoesterase, partial [Alphaproteobacteria bacterium]|nr:YmdB family metallophosphoesterase [Alphaproteobacteria bacterium]